MECASKQGLYYEEEMLGVVVLQAQPGVTRVPCPV